MRKARLHQTQSVCERLLAHYHQLLANLLDYLEKRPHLDQLQQQQAIANLWIGELSLARLALVLFETKMKQRILTENQDFLLSQSSLLVRANLRPATRPFPEYMFLQLHLANLTHYACRPA